MMQEFDVNASPREAIAALVQRVRIPADVLPAAIAAAVVLLVVPFLGIAEGVREEQARAQWRLEMHRLDHARRRAADLSRWERRVESEVRIADAVAMTSDRDARYAMTLADLARRLPDGAWLDAIGLSKDETTVDGHVVGEGLVGLTVRAASDASGMTVRSVTTHMEERNDRRTADVPPRPESTNVHIALEERRR
jgi:Tfp pilus assembly protein PilN